jgi:hypothetical protein
MKRTAKVRADEVILEHLMMVFGRILWSGRLVSSEPWQSLTFSGQRIILELKAHSAGVRDAWREFVESALPEIEFKISGGIVADIGATMTSNGFAVEVLVIDE